MSCINCSAYAAIMPRVSGGLSAASSTTIIYLIFRSEARLSTIYHRIMFGMSICDIISSIAIACSTLLMPKELPFSTNEFYGTRLGNFETCEIQGFCYIFGFTAVFAYNAMLFLYNTCTIAFMMKERHIKRYIEPILHIVPWAMGLGIAIPPLFQNHYNPTKWDAWCTLAAAQSIENDEQGLRLIETIVRYSCMAFIAIICTCFLLMLCRVIQIDRTLQRPKRLKRRAQYRSDTNTATKSLENTKVVVLQVMAYIFSFMVTVGLLLIRSVIKEPHWMFYLSFALVPLQGFFNAIIFISHKVYSYRRVHEDVSRISALGLLFRGRVTEQILFSRISMIMRDVDQKWMDVVVSDEQNNNQRLRIHCQDIEPGSQSGGGDVFFDEEESKDVDGFSYFSSKGEDGHGKGNGDDDVRSSRHGLSGFLSLDETSSPSSGLNATRNTGTNSNAVSIGEEDGRSVEESNGRSVLSRMTWMSRGYRSH